MATMVAILSDPVIVACNYINYSYSGLVLFTAVYRKLNLKQFGCAGCIE
jgi:hypothetical protein